MYQFIESNPAPGAVIHDLTRASFTLEMRTLATQSRLRRPDDRKQFIPRKNTPHDEKYAAVVLVFSL